MMMMEDYAFMLQLRVTIVKNPGLGFSIAGGMGSPGNPFKPKDMVSGISVVQN